MHLDQHRRKSLKRHRTTRWAKCPESSQHCGSSVGSSHDSGDSIAINGISSVPFTGYSFRPCNPRSSLGPMLEWLLACRLHTACHQLCPLHTNIQVSSPAPSRSRPLSGPPGSSHTSQQTNHYRVDKVEGQREWTKQLKNLLCLFTY